MGNGSNVDVLSTGLYEHATLDNFMVLNISDDNNSNNSISFFLLSFVENDHNISIK